MTALFISRFALLMFVCVAIIIPAVAAAYISLGKDSPFFMSSWSLAFWIVCGQLIALAVYPWGHLNAWW